MEFMSSCRPSTSEWISKLNSILHFNDVQHDFDFILVGHIENVLINLPEALKKSGFKTLVIGAPGMYLLKSPFIDYSITLDSRTQSRFLDELFLNQDFLLKCTGTFLWCSDEIMKEIVDRDVPLSLKIKLLPTKNPEFMKVLGSKVGQDSMFHNLNVKTPNSKVLKTYSESQSFFNNDGKNRVLVKGNHSGGGSFIKQVSSGEQLDLAQIPRDWFPLLIQDFEIGDTVSVEAYYREGILVLWLYSYTIMTTSILGPSMVRKYEIPPNLDFLDELKRIGETAKINGFANVSLIWNSEKQRHLMIEFDLRPNVWHQAFLDFDIPFGEIWRDKRTSFVEEYGVIEGFRYEPYRLFDYMLNRFRIFSAVRVLMGSEFRDYGRTLTSSFFDPGVRRRNQLLLIFFFFAPLRRYVLKIGILFKQNLPVRLQELIDNSCMKRWLLRILVR